jgi:multidrug efflux pump subunit AcrA (membrane-fusion protein)
MRLHTLVRPAVALLVVAAAGAGAYFTRDHWLPYVFPSPQAAKEDDHGHDEHDEEGPAKVKISPQARANLGLKSAPLVPQPYWRKLIIPGVVVDRPGESDRRVSSRVAGVVGEAKVKLGDTVKPGQELFTIQLVSELLQTTQAELARAANDLQFATVERDRIAGLVKLGTLAAPEQTRQQNVVDRHTTAVKAARRQLAALGLTKEQIEQAERGESVTQVVVTAPGTAGPVSSLSQSLVPGPQFEVRHLFVAPGDHVQAGQVLAQLADHRRLLVEGAAYKSEAKALAAVMAEKVPVEAEFSDEKPGEWAGTEKLHIQYIAEHVDPVTRTLSFYLPLQNQSVGGVWRFSPGQRVRLRVPVERLATRRPDGTPADPFVLPAGALVREGGEAFVFVQVADVYVRRPVHVLYEDRDEAVVANDGSVTRADEVVLNQAAALNRAVKAALGGQDHGHDHGHEH